MTPVQDFLPAASIGAAAVTRLPDGYSQLLVRGVPYMSDMPLEDITNREFVKQARGDVFVAGLGLGFVLRPILAKSEVDSVTVLEREADVIRLVAPRVKTLPGNHKIKIIHGDAFTWNAGPRRWDVIYFDIWPDIHRRNLVQMDSLEKRYRPNLKPGGWMTSWTFDVLTHA